MRVRLLGVILVAFVLGGCASAGANFRWEDVASIEPGMTEEEVLDLLGEPTMVTVAGGQSTWTWSHATANFLGSIKSKAVSIVFEDGVVAEAPAVSAAMPFKDREFPEETTSGFD